LTFLVCPSKETEQEYSQRAVGIEKKQNKEKNPRRVSVGGGGWGDEAWGGLKGESFIIYIKKYRSPVLDVVECGNRRLL
jgi:hypothetical protein